MSQTEALSILQARVNLATWAAIAQSDSLAHFYVALQYEQTPKARQALLDRMAQFVDEFEATLRQAFPNDDVLINNAIQLMDEFAQKRLEIRWGYLK